MNFKEELSKNISFYNEDFLNYLESVNRSPRTVESYQRDLHKFFLWCKKSKIKRLERVRPKHISAYLDFLRSGNGKLSVSSQKRHLSTLKNFFTFLVEKHPRVIWIPFKGFKKSPFLSKLHTVRLKDEDVQNTPLLKEEHWLRIQSMVLRADDQLLLALMYWGGLRLSEALSLKGSQLDAETKAITFIRKGGKRHKLYLIDDGEILPLWFHLMARKQEFLFTQGLRKKPLTRRAAYKKVKKVFQKAGLPKNLSPHSLRKACATRLYKQSRDLIFVRDYLGHSDAKVTQTYIDLGPEGPRENLGSRLPQPLQYQVNNHAIIQNEEFLS